MATQWVYRPRDEEHEKLLKFMADNPEFRSVAQVVREAMLRLFNAEDQNLLFTEVSDLITSLKEDRDKFLEILLRYTE